MRLPWIDSVNFRIAFAVAITLMVVQIMLGTSLQFAVLTFVYLLTCVLAFNIAGGLNTYSGSFIFFNATQSLVIALFAKVFMLQAADSNLIEPVETAFLYVVGELALLAAVIVVRKQHTKRPWLDANKQMSHLWGMSIAGTVLGITATLIVGLNTSVDTHGLATGDSQLYSFLHQLPLFTSLGIVLGTAYILRTTNNKKAMAWYVAVPILFDTTVHFIQNTKSGTYQPLITWVLTCAAFRYRFNRAQVGMLIGAIVLGAFFVFPFVQMSRGDVREGNLARQAALTGLALKEYGLTGAYYAYRVKAELREESDFREQQLYYGRDMGVLDRLSLIAQEDALVHASDRMPPRGLGPFADVAIGFIPRVIFPEKDMYIGVALPNEMGHAIGQLGPSDEVTKIAFSHFGPAYYMVRWWAPLLIFVCAVPMFGLLDRIYGDVRTNFFCLIAIATNIHTAAESNPGSFIGNIIALTLQAVLPIVLVRLISPFVQVLLARRHVMFGDETAPQLVVRSHARPGQQPMSPAARPARP